ncbi:hypothetical protein CAE01nite_22490 [Cellulomonas aerilata]|uniref:Uncharacterized protein n=1 Tax=Cellulomonas aerilata TaxID=515326 RepID=A0A512DDG6_9CELL|nr:hypothetical protein CAE01nite_22490 [Cellulomonas aerilata]
MSAGVTWWKLGGHTSRDEEARRRRPPKWRFIAGERVREPDTVTEVRFGAA